MVPENRDSRATSIKTAALLQSLWLLDETTKAVFRQMGLRTMGQTAPQPAPVSNPKAALSDVETAPP